MFRIWMNEKYLYGGKCIQREMIVKIRYKLNVQ